MRSWSGMEQISILYDRWCPFENTEVYEAFVLPIINRSSCAPLSLQPLGVQQNTLPVAYRYMMMALASSLSTRDKKVRGHARAGRRAPTRHITSQLAQTFRKKESENGTRRPTNATLGYSSSHERETF
jgi:hypothetical protein